MTPSHLKWRFHCDVNKDSKSFHPTPSYPCKMSWDFCKKTDSNDIIKQWKMTFQASDGKGNHFLDLLDNDFNSIEYHIQVHLSGNNVPTVKLPLNHTSPPSMAATFLATRLMVVLQPSRYSVFHDRVNPVSVSTLKLPLGVIGVVTLKPWASPILPLCI